MSQEPQTNGHATHLMVTIAQNDRPIAYRVLDLARGEYRLLTKELGYRAVASDIALARRPWRVALHLDGVNTEEPRLRVEALPESAAAGHPLAALSLPMDNLAWIASQLAAHFQVKGDYMMYVKVLPADDPRVEKWSEAMEDPNFELTESSAPRLEFPGGFDPSPLGPRRVIRSVGSWLRCVFRPESLAMFLAAAARETSEERGWAVATRIHVFDGACYAVVEDLVEMPATAGRNYLVTHGRDFLALRARLGERLGGFCHLHPPEVEGQPLAPQPSGPDTVVAWNLDAVTASPIVAPIAMFGATLENAPTRMAAHGYQAGILTEIDLEVLE